jgi:hypothetical protein
VPWRLGPQAASIALLGVGALIAAATELRVSGPSRQPSALAASDAPFGSINRTLTLDDDGCAGVTSAVWHPLSGIEYTGRLRVTLPAHLGGAIVLYVGDTIPLDIEASTVNGAPVALHHERLLLGAGVMVPPDFWIEDGSPTEAPQHLSRLQIDAGQERRVVIVSLGRRAARVLTRLAGYPPSVRLPVCAQALAAGEQYFGAGWFGEERDLGAGPVRWMRDHGAVMVARHERGNAHVRARLAPGVMPDDGERPELTLRVNEVWSAPPVALAGGFHYYEWSVPNAAWAAGTNELFFSVSRTRWAGSRQLGLALASLDVR